MSGRATAPMYDRRGNLGGRSISPICDRRGSVCGRGTAPLCDRRGSVCGRSTTRKCCKWDSLSGYYGWWQLTDNGLHDRARATCRVVGDNLWCGHGSTSYGYAKKWI